MISKNLKQFSLFVIILGGLLFGIDGVITWGAKHNFRSDLGKVNLVMSHRVDPDIMIFGSSTAEVGFDSPLLENLSGKTVYNAALDGTHFKQLDCLIREFMAYSSRCRYVILAVSPHSLSPASQIYAIERFLPQITNPLVFRSLCRLDPGLAYKCRFVPFYKYTEVTSDYYKEAALGLGAWIRGRDRATPADTLEGFTPNYQEWQRDASGPGNPVFSIPVDTPTYGLLRDLIAGLRARGKTVMLVVTPIQTEGRRLIANWAEIDHRFEDLGRTSDYYFDFSDDTISENKGYFYNFSHLNAGGAEVFTKSFFQRINNVLHPYQ